MPTAREWRQIDRDRGDQDLVRRAAAWLRDDPARAGYAGLSRDGDAAVLAALLDLLAAELPSCPTSTAASDARHACLTYLATRGVPDVIVSAWAGHADLSLAKRVYVHPTAEHLRGASDALAELLG